MREVCVRFYLLCPLLVCFSVPLYGLLGVAKVGWSGNLDQWELTVCTFVCSEVY